MPRDIDLSAASRPLLLRMRADLVIVPQMSPSGMRWAVKDATAQRYWRLGPEESFLLRSLDGRTSASELCARFAREFAPRRMTVQQLTGFLADLHREGLIVADRPGQAEAIIGRQRQWRRSAPLRALGHLLAWRFRGVDPDRGLDRVRPRCEWLFTTRAAALFLLLLFSALLLAVLQWPSLDRDLADLPSSLTANQVLLVLALIGVVKVLHELGHAIACKHFGGECHELGLMLLLGAPSLYCNVSDAWMLPHKRPRILISAAGILVELTLASLAAWLWWWTSPGLIHSLALYVMVICSVNTVLLNGNPLLQFDGYYILADLTDTPNLRAQARSAVRRLLARAVLGLRLETAAPWHERRRWLSLYGVASALYRWAVVLGAAWYLHKILQPYGAQFLSWILGGLLAAALLLEPALDAARFFRRPGWDREVPWGWVWLRAGAVAVLCLSLLFVPLPASVVAPIVLEPRSARTVYVEVEGRLAWTAPPAAEVEAGEEIARLENVPLAAELARLTGERDVKRQRLQNLLRRQADPAAAAQIRTAEESLADAEERLRQRQRDFERLVIRAPRAGIVLPPPWRTADDRPVPTWTGTPLDPENLGCQLQTGDVICIIGEPRAIDALVFVRQGDEDLIQIGQPAQVLVDSFPHRHVAGAVAVPATVRAVEAPQELLVRGELSIERDHRGQPRPMQAIFQAKVELVQQSQPLLLGATGRAKISIAPQSLAARLSRSLWQTFRGR